MAQAGKQAAKAKRKPQPKAGQKPSPPGPPAAKGRAAAPAPAAARKAKAPSSAPRRTRRAEAGATAPTPVAGQATSPLVAIAGQGVRGAAAAQLTRGSADGRRPLVLAMPKGRILEEAAAVFARAGYDLAAALGDSRRLVHDCGPLRVLVLRSADVPTYVAHGAADLGVAGSDVLDEQGRDLYEPLDLGIGICRMVVAERADAPIDERSQMHIRIATKYPRITRAYLQRRGLTAEIIKLSGSIELGPLTGLSDRIVDLTQTGETLRQNGLREVETILAVSSRLVVNPASLKLRGADLSELISRLETAVQAADSGQTAAG